jgi:transcriptional regulator with XRE-family HTH domain
MYEKYKELRDKKGVSDYRVAVETGINKSTFSDWASGRSAPKIEKLKKIADYFGVGIDYFLTK